MTCLTFHTFRSQWYTARLLLLTCGMEQNPGSDSLSFCTWKLNSIDANDVLGVSFLEAYYSVYNNYLKGSLETQLNSTVDENKIPRPRGAYLILDTPEGGLFREGAF